MVLVLGCKECLLETPNSRSYSSAGLLTLPSQPGWTPLACPRRGDCYQPTFSTQCSPAWGQDPGRMSAFFPFQACGHWLPYLEVRLHTSARWGSPRPRGVAPLPQELFFKHWFSVGSQDHLPGHCLGQSQESMFLMLFVCTLRSEPVLGFPLVAGTFLTDNMDNLLCAR